MNPSQPAARPDTAITRRRAMNRIGASGVAAAFLAATAQRADAQSALTDAATEAAARRAINAINQAIRVGDMTLLDLAFAPDYENHTPHRSPSTGQRITPDLAGLEAGLVELRAAVPNAVVVVDDVVASGETAAVRLTLRGTTDPAVVPLPDGAAARLAIGGAAFLRIVDGRVVESWLYDESAEAVAALSRPAPTPTPTPEPVEQPATPGEARDVSNFNEVQLDGVGTLLIEQSDTESLTIEAEDRVLRRIDTEVQRGRLIIRPARSFNAREPITYHLRVIDLTAIVLSGAGAAEAGALTTDHLGVNLEGAGSLTISNLTAETLEVTASGTGAVTLAGTVGEQTVSLTGTATYAGEALESQSASVMIDQAAQATVNATETLVAQVGGAGRLAYIGNPEVQQDVSAAGSITQAG